MSTVRYSAVLLGIFSSASLLACGRSMSFTTKATSTEEASSAAEGTRVSSPESGDSLGGANKDGPASADASPGTVPQGAASEPVTDSILTPSEPASLASADVELTEQVNMDFDNEAGISDDLSDPEFDKRREKTESLENGPQALALEADLNTETESAPKDEATASDGSEETPLMSALEDFSSKETSGRASDMPSLENTVTEIKNACAELPLQSQKKILRFSKVDNAPDPNGPLIANNSELVGSTCNWLRWDGRNRTSGFRAYAPDEAPTLPEGATLCSSSLRSEFGDDVKWTYDDEFVLTVNNRVLASSRKDYVPRFPEQDGFALFDFNPILGLSYSSYTGDSLYCFGHEGSGPGCTFPPTQTTGPVDLDFPNESFAFVSAFLKQERALDVRLVIAGDNDPRVDCEHDGITFEWTWNYVFENAP